MSYAQENQQARLKLNVGGKIFETTVATLNKYPESLLANMFVGDYKVQPDTDGVYFIDRDGSLFGYVVNFLRDETIALPSNQHDLEQLEREARYYGLTQLENLIVQQKKDLQNRWSQSYVAPQSSGSNFGLSITGGSLPPYSSGSGFGFGTYSASTASGAPYGTVTSFDPNLVHHPMSSQDDPARDLFAGSTSSELPTHDTNTTTTTTHGPFGPPLTTSQSQNIELSLDGPYLLEPKNLSDPSLYEAELETGNEEGGF
eukprot:TRINITY_DN11847_c0_g1_i1.p1 TRINITY_DN11847_c0_g1~~TRINITY_DN11847_c0_g1_i1.p1  ORF type:complete len:258 (-),score=49.30 TRINITY_DN11847_c0_g1_i1:124-897(-)